MSRLLTAAATDTGYLRGRPIKTSPSQQMTWQQSLTGWRGHLGGEVAARIAVEELLNAYRRDRTTEGLVRGPRVSPTRAVYRRSMSDRNLRGMGTTLTAAGFVGDEPDDQLRLALVNVGDSRAYLLDRPGQRILKLTDDHSVVEEMVRSGELTPDEAAVHPHRHILTRALGIEPRSNRTAGSSTSSLAAASCSAATGSRTSCGEQEIGPGAAR